MSISAEEYKNFLRATEDPELAGDEVRLMQALISATNGKLNINQLLELLNGNTINVEGAESWDGSYPPGWIPAECVEDVVRGT